MKLKEILDMYDTEFWGPSDIEFARQQINLLVEGLKFYADETRFQRTEVSRIADVFAIREDCPGDKAREVLRACGFMGEE